MVSGKFLTLALVGLAVAALVVFVLFEHVPQSETETGRRADAKVPGEGIASVEDGQDAPAATGRSVGVTMAGRGKQELLSGMEGLKDGKARETYLAGMVSRIAALRPEEALEQVRLLQDAEARDMLMLALLAQWSGATTLDLVRNRDVTRFGVAGALALYLMDSGKFSPAQAAALAKEGGAGRQAELLARVASKLVTTDPAAAVAMGSGFEGRQQNRFYESLARAWGASAPDAARQWASQIPDPELRARVQTSILQAEAAGNPAAAARSFTQFPPGAPESRTRLAGSIAESWANKDTVAAMQWASSLADPSDQAAALQGIQRAAPVGIGARVVSGNDGFPVLTDFVPGSPASMSGQLRPGDKLLAVSDGQGGWVDPRGLPLGQVVDLIRGAPNTQVSLRVQDSGGSGQRVITLGRQQIIHRTP
ncbi:MAG: PDZ domain-containing protein [Chthoniobacterales bacterium]|nr:PDZ domain-containing protein [Chthoniobacterales bacterium]